MAQYCGDEIGAIVGDIGFHTSKFGYAGELLPAVVTPTSVGVVSEPDGAKRCLLGSSKIENPLPGMEVVNPLDSKGYVTDWDLIQQLWEHACVDMLKADFKEHPILISETIYSLQPQRERLVEMMFESFEVPALFLAKQSVLSAFSLGKSTALVVDMGANSTRVVPVIDGYALHKPSSWSKFGGEKLTSILAKDIIETKQVAVRPRYMLKKTASADGVTVSEVTIEGLTDSYKEFMCMNVVRDVKEIDLTVWPKKYDDTPLLEVEYELPDGTQLHFGKEQCTIPELLFDPDPIASRNHRYTGLAKLVHETLLACDPDCRRELCANIVLVGGASKLRGIGNRLTAELKALIPHAFRVSVQHPPGMRSQFSVWTGGSILASLGSFHQLWVSKAEYAEDGVGTVERRCP